jgi:hypothetical protein
MPVFNFCPYCCLPALISGTQTAGSTDASSQAEPPAECNTQSNLLKEFVTNVKDSLRTIPFPRVHKSVFDICTKLNLTHGSFVTEEEYYTKEYASEQENLIESRKLVGKMRKELDDDVNIPLEELIEYALEHNVSITSSLLLLEKRERSGLETSKLTFADTGAGAGEHKAGDKSDANTKSTATAAAADSADDDDAAEDVDDDKKAGEDDGANLQVIRSLNLSAAINCMYEDFISWLNRFVENAKNIPQPLPLPGIMVISEQAVATFAEDSDSNIRRQ